MALPALVYILAAASVALLGKTFFNPKMMNYHMTLGLPMLTYTENEWKLFVNADIDLVNSNLLHLDVHKLHFDFYSQHRHIGHAVDSSNQPQQAVWSVAAQSRVQKTTGLYMRLRSWNVLQSLADILLQYWNLGHIVVPTTGVAHIKAAPHNATFKSPLTLSMTCDNRLDVSLWSGIAITGVACDIQGMEAGWSNLQDSTLRIRERTLKALLAGT